MRSKSSKNNNKSGEKIDFKLSFVIRGIVFVIIGTVALWFGLRIAFNVNEPFYVVTSGSMGPTLQVNDFLVVRKDPNYSFDKLAIGDIIAFHEPDGISRVIVHRVFEIRDNNYHSSIPTTSSNSIRTNHPSRIVVTKGDANPGPIPGIDYPITEKEYIGRIVYVIPAIGIITNILTPPIPLVIIVVILVIMFFYWWRNYARNTNIRTLNSNTLDKREKDNRQ